MRLKLALILLLLASRAVAASADGTILGWRPYAPNVASYEELVERLAAAPAADERDPPFDEAAFRRARPPRLFDALKSGDVEASRFFYASDGLKVEGYMVRPARLEAKSPVIVYLRGGNRGFGEISLAQVLDMTAWAQRGYVVLATSYRGSTRSEGEDEFGGDDVRDVHSLIAAAAHIEQADTDNVFLIGVSRGGMMAYRAVAEGAPVRAAAIVGGLADLGANAASRPQMLEIYRSLMPDFAEEQATGFCRRSAVCWPEKLDAPLLVLHGADDWRVDAADAERLVAAVNAAGGAAELVVYPGDDHMLGRNASDAWDRALAFFAAHGKAG